MVERLSHPNLSSLLRGWAGAGLVIVIALGALVFAALGRWAPFVQAPCPAADCTQPASAVPAGADTADLRAAAPITSVLPAYFPRVEASPRPAFELLSQLGGSSRGIALRGSTVFVGLGARVLTFDVADPDAPVEIGHSPLLPGVVEDIQLAGDLAWIAVGGAGILALDVTRPDDITVVGAFDTPSHSFSLDVSEDVGLLADTDHLIALDLRDPAAIREFGRWKAPEHAVHVTRHGETAFLTDERNGLHVLDISNPASMKLIDVFDRDGAGNGQASLVYGSTLYFNSAREIYVLDVRDPNHLVEVGRLDVGEDRGYVRAGMVIARSGLVANGRLYDLSDPWAPRRVSGPLHDTKGTDLVRDDNVATDGDFVVAARDHEHGGFILGDLTDPRAPRRRGGMRTLGDFIGEDLSRLPNEAALDLGGKRIDVRDAKNPRLAGESAFPRGAIRLNNEWGISSSAVDSSRSGALFKLVTLQPPLREVPIPASSGDDGASRWYTESASLLGDTAWIAGSMLRVDRTSPFPCPIVATLDLNDIERPRWAGKLNTVEDLPASITQIATDAASSTVVIGHDRSRCDGYWLEGPVALSIVDATDPENPAVISHLTVPAPVRDIVTWQGTAFVAADIGGLRVIDLAGPGAPREIANVVGDGNERALELELAWPYLWLGYSTSLRLIDIREPARPRELQRRDVPSEIVAMTLHHGMLWVATEEAGLLGYRASPREFTEAVSSASTLRMSNQEPTATSVYLVGSPSVDVLTPSRLAEELSIQSTTDWQEVLRLNDLSPIDVLIIDNDSYERVDWQWVSDRSEHGIVVVGINVALREITRLVPSADLQQFLLESNGAPSPPSIHPGDRASILAIRIEAGSSGGYFGLSDEYVNHPQTLAMGPPGSPFFHVLGVHLQNLKNQ